MPKAKEKALAKAAPRFERIDLVAKARGISTSLLRKLFNQRKLVRYKLGTATMIDTAELDALIVADTTGNHGPERAPKLSRG
jgi:hypothetical protein